MVLSRLIHVYVHILVSFAVSQTYIFYPEKDKYFLLTFPTAVLRPKSSEAFTFTDLSMGGPATKLANIMDGQ